MVSHLYDGHFKTLQSILDQELSRLGFEKLLIYSGDFKLYFMQDQVYPFKANPWFTALVPITDAPKSWVVWSVNHKPLLLLFRPHDDFWHDLPETPDPSWAKHFDVHLLQTPDVADTYFGDTEKSAFLGEIDQVNNSWDISHIGALLAPQRIDGWSLGERNPQRLINALEWHRAYKTPYEQDCIQQANRISAQGHLAAHEAFRGGASEFEIAVAFQQGCHLNLDELAYPSIVCLNEKAATLHSTGYSKAHLSKDKIHSLLIDAGAAYQGYTSDVTRTYAYTDGIFAELLSAFDEMQQRIANSIHAGQSYVEFGIAALLQLSQLLKDFDVFTVEPSLALETGIIHQFMPHALGHPMGLQVHDVGWNFSDANGTVIQRHPQFPQHRTTRVVETNQVLTVEPGVYFIDGLLKSLKGSQYHDCINWSRVEVLKPYGGIRIEDDVLITDSSVENITRQAFREVSG